MYSRPTATAAVHASLRPFGRPDPRHAEGSVRPWTPWGARSAMHAHPCAAARHSSRDRDGDHHRSSERCWRLVGAAPSGAFGPVRVDDDAVEASPVSSPSARRRAVLVCVSTAHDRAPQTDEGSGRLERRVARAAKFTCAAPTFAGHVLTPLKPSSHRRSSRHGTVNVATSGRS